MDATKFSVLMEPSPWSGRQPKRVAIAINDDFFRSALDPLPSDREIDPHSAAAAIAAQKKRQLLAGMVADALKKAVLQLLQEDDTENGYPPQPRTS